MQFFAELEMSCVGLNALRARDDAGRKCEHENYDDGFYFSQG
jgi:hypothetical protein